MPTITLNIAGNADDGGAQVTAGGSSINNAATVVYIGNGGGIFNVSGWLRFTGITIPQSSTINSATLKCYAHGNWASINMKIKLDSRQTPGNPSTTAQVTNPTNVQGTVSTTVTYPTTYPFPWSLYSIDVTSLVQGLVNSYGYSNGEMVFYASTPTLGSAKLYQRDLGTSKDAELVIDYAGGAPVLTDKTTVNFDTGETW
jgi:hypothetical protein